MILDHIGLSVENYDECKAFYIEALKPLGISLQIEFKEYQVCGFGKGGKAEFWLEKGVPTRSQMHIAFQADSKDIVDAFYDAAIKAGGIDNGKPGIREVYHPKYYGAFVIDPEGHNVEAVCHQGYFEDES